MKKIIIILCLFFAVTVLHARAIHEDYREADERAKISYAFGMAIATNFSLGSMGIEFDYAAFAEGLRATVENEETQFTEQEALELIEAALHSAMEARAAVNRQQEEEFLAANARRSGVRTTDSGLQYEILRAGRGERPNDDSVVRVIYTGTFIDGSLFDSSSERDGSYIPLDMVIPGWAEGLMLMDLGSQYKLFIPSELAYGSEGIQGIIPPHSTLIFTVELMEIINEDD